jgi:hypothetical protein
VLLRIVVSRIADLVARAAIVRSYGPALTTVREPKASSKIESISKSGKRDDLNIKNSDSTRASCPTGEFLGRVDGHGGHPDLLSTAI